MSRLPNAGRSPTRREVLAACAAGGVSSLTGCSLFDDGDQRPDLSPVERTPASGKDTEEVPRALRDQYGTVTNVVDAGADHTGQQPIDDVLRSAAGDDTLLYLPRGEYRVEGQIDLVGVSDLALVGDRALVRPPDGFTGLLFLLGAESGVTGLRFEGIDFDFTATNTGARPIHALADDGLLVRGVTVRGQQDVDHDCMRFDVTSESGTGRIERVRLPDGSTAKYPNTGIYVGRRSRGELSFVDCTVAGFSDNGLYASQAPGPSHVKGGHYANNDIANVRVSGGSTVEGVRVTCDTTRSGVENMRGIRLREGSDISVRDCTIEMHSVTASGGAITMAPWLENATVQDTTVVLGADNVSAVTAKPPQQSVGDTASVEFKGLRVRGSAANGATVRVLERSECLFENVCIYQDGSNRNGIEFSDSRGNVLQNTVVDVTGDPLVLQESSAQRMQFRTRLRGGSCQ